ncbi:MAG: NUDIX domain-containing protein [Candidatus Devosia phytovorans]|uniref:NUDIX domain-containing protein n=1 Tax=Candidatus Devosia phytovorans TaxID=3121372 RepID=A0AAJ5VU95_9HYPH|nr:NUDIX domain-containing protein [Devosia sp.]WEK04904.1 MAG: NUDIX domain-containing protein [Devosia sp.]
MSERVVLSFPVGGTRFNYRVAGAAIRDGHVLVCREDEDDYCMLPGGRVEMGEPSDVALVREMAEELVMPVAVGDLLFTSESFYGREGDRYHELGFIYAIELPEDVRPGGLQPFLVREDEGHVLQFSWLPLEGDALSKARLLPPWLPERLRGLANTPAHVIFREATP